MNDALYYWGDNKLKLALLTEMAMAGNRWLILMLWLLNLAVVGSTIFFALEYVMKRPAPDTAIYVPLDSEIPTVESPKAWDAVTPRPKSIGGARNPSSAAFASLHSSDWNRRESPPMPQLRPTNQPPVNPPVQPPTREEALAQLQQELVLVMIWAPDYAQVALKRAPNELITVVSEAAFKHELAQRQRFSPGYKPDPASRSNIHDLTPLGCAAKVIEILPAGLRVKYTYKATEFELDFTRDNTNVSPFGGTPNSAADWRSGLSADFTSSSSAPATNKPAPGPSSSASGPSTPQPANPPATGNRPPVNDIQESFEESAGVWVIAGKEVDHVRDNMDVMINELQVKSNFNGKEYEGVTLQAVPANSLAAKRGFVPGDTVLSINGQPVNSINEVKNYVRQNKNLPEYVVVILRRGEKITRTFKVPRKD